VQPASSGALRIGAVLGSSWWVVATVDATERTQRFVAPAVRLTHLLAANSAEVFTDAFEDGVFFAEPASPRQRGPTRTPMVASASSFRGAKRRRSTRPRIWLAPRSSSTPDRATCSTGRHPSRSSPANYPDSVRMLRRPYEFTTSDACDTDIRVAHYSSPGGSTEVTLAAWQHHRGRAPLGDVCDHTDAAGSVMRSTSVRRSPFRSAVSGSGAWEFYVVIRASYLCICYD
jgi:hypothetical protein